LEITKKTANECANFVADTLKPVLRLNDWTFDWRFEQMDRSSDHSVTMGQAHVDYNRLEVVIFVDTFRHEDDFVEFMDTLRHEVLHATHFMWSRAINIFREMVPEGFEELAAAYWADACEEHVAYLGRILDSLGYDVDSLAQRFVSTLVEQAE
jgi:hypothetical protein